MTDVVTPAPTPVTPSVDGANFPQAATAWSVQSAVNGSDQNLMQSVGA